MDPRYALEPIPSRDVDPMTRLYPVLLAIAFAMVGVLGYVIGR